MQVENYYQVGNFTIVKVVASGNFALMLSKNKYLLPERYKTKDEVCEVAHDYAIIAGVKGY